MSRPTPSPSRPPLDTPIAAGSMMAQAPASAPSVTITSTSNPPLDMPTGTLRLRGAAEESARRPRVRWEEDVVDNEGLGRKKSKICCIYHPTREFGESSDESSSSSGSDSDSEDSESDGGPSRRKKSVKDGIGGGGGDDCGHDHAHAHGGGSSGSGKKRGRAKRRKNAYEKQPTIKR